MALQSAAAAGGSVVRVGSVLTVAISFLWFLWFLE
jgi:hypothetical protein